MGNRCCFSKHHPVYEKILVDLFGMKPLLPLKNNGMFNNNLHELKRDSKFNVDNMDKLVKYTSFYSKNLIDHLETNFNKIPATIKFLLLKTQGKQKLRTYLMVTILLEELILNLDKLMPFKVERIDSDEFILIEKDKRPQKQQQTSAQTQLNEQQYQQQQNQKQNDVQVNTKKAIVVKSSNIQSIEKSIKQVDTLNHTFKFESDLFQSFINLIVSKKAQDKQKDYEPRQLHLLSRVLTLIVFYFRNRPSENFQQSGKCIELLDLLIHNKLLENSNLEQLKLKSDFNFNRCLVLYQLMQAIHHMCAKVRKIGLVHHIQDLITLILNVQAQIQVALCGSGKERGVAPSPSKVLQYGLQNKRSESTGTGRNGKKAKKGKQPSKSALKPLQSANESNQNQKEEIQDQQELEKEDILLSIKLVAHKMLEQIAAVSFRINEHKKLISSVFSYFQRTQWAHQQMYEEMLQRLLNVANRNHDIIQHFEVALISKLCDCISFQHQAQNDSNNDNLSSKIAQTQSNQNTQNINGQQPISKMLNLLMELFNGLSSANLAFMYIGRIVSLAVEIGEPALPAYKSFLMKMRLLPKNSFSILQLLFSDMKSSLKKHKRIEPALLSLYDHTLECIESLPSCAVYPDDVIKYTVDLILKCENLALSESEERGYEEAKVILYRCLLGLFTLENIISNSSNSNNIVNNNSNPNSIIKLEQIQLQESKNILLSSQSTVILFVQLYKTFKNMITLTAQKESNLKVRLIQVIYELLDNINQRQGIHLNSLVLSFLEKLQQLLENYLIIKPNVLDAAMEYCLRCFIILCLQNIYARIQQQSTQQLKQFQFVKMKFSLQTIGKSQIFEHLQKEFVSSAKQSQVETNKSMSVSQAEMQAMLEMVKNLECKTADSKQTHIESDMLIQSFNELFQNQNAHINTNKSLQSQAMQQSNQQSLLISDALHFDKVDSLSSDYSSDSYARGGDTLSQSSFILEKPNGELQAQIIGGQSDLQLQIKKMKNNKENENKLQQIFENMTNKL